MTALRSSSGQRRPGPSRAYPRDRVRARRFHLTALYQVNRLRPADNLGQGRRPVDPRRQACRRHVPGRHGSRGRFERPARTCRLDDLPAAWLRAFRSRGPRRAATGFVVLPLALTCLVIHVTDDAGNRFSCIRRPGTGREDFDNLDRERARTRSRAASSTPTIPYTVDENGARLTDHAPGPSSPAGRVLNDKGEKGDANGRGHQGSGSGRATARALGRLKHQYPAFVGARKSR